MNRLDGLSSTNELNDSIEILLSPEFNRKQPGDNFKEILKPIKDSLGVPHNETIFVRFLDIRGIPNFTQTIIFTTHREMGYYWNPFP